MNREPLEWTIRSTSGVRLIWTLGERFVTVVEPVVKRDGTYGHATFGVKDMSPLDQKLLKATLEHALEEVNRELGNRDTKVPTAGSQRPGSP